MSTVRLETLGPCPVCGRERLLRQDVVFGPGLTLRTRYVFDCGTCPTAVVTFEPPSDEQDPSPF